MTGAHAAVWSFPFPLAGGGQSGSFGGFGPDWCLAGQSLWPLLCVCTWCAHSSRPEVVWWVGSGLDLRRQSKTSALNTDGQWGFPPGPARSPCPWWSWSSRLDSSGRCRCPCRGWTSRNLVRRHQVKHSLAKYLTLDSQLGSELRFWTSFTTCSVMLTVWVHVVTRHLWRGEALLEGVNVVAVGLHGDQVLRLAWR